MKRHPKRTRVYVQQSLRTPAAKAIDANGEVVEVPFIRLYVNLRIGLGGRNAYDGVLDSGAPLTLLPRVCWEPLAPEIEWLTPQDIPGQKNWLSQISGRTGGKSSVRLGRIDMRVFDLERSFRISEPIRVLAWCELPRVGNDQILVGVHESMMQGRRLHCDIDNREAWLEEL